MIFDMSTRQGISAVCYFEPRYRTVFVESTHSFATLCLAAKS